MAKKVGQSFQSIVDESLIVTHIGEENKLIFESNGKKAEFNYILNTVPTHMLSDKDWIDITIIRQGANKGFHLAEYFPKILGCYEKNDPNFLPQTVFRFTYDIIFQYHIEKNIKKNQEDNLDLSGPKRKKPIIVSSEVLNTIFGQK